MLQNFQKSVIYSKSPKDLAYDIGKEILERNKKLHVNGITIVDLVELICKENKQLAIYFGYDKDRSLKIKDNRKTKDVKELLLNNSHIKEINSHPIVLKWFDDNDNDNDKDSDSGDNDVNDVNDKKIDPDQIKNNEKNNEKNGSENVSPTSLTSPRNNQEGEESESELESDNIDKLVQIGKGPPQGMTNEQHDSFFVGDQDY
jgi:hypothetical protein